MTCSRSYSVALIYYIVTQMCLVYGQEFNKSSLTFVIDDSGSMTDEIEQVKRSVDSIFETVMMSNTSQIQNFVLVTFNDPDYILHVVTENKDVFRAAASAVHVRDGIPQCPEKAMTGIKVAIENSLPLSTLYVFTDASAKDSDMYEEVKNMAQKKQIQITFMLTGDCGSRKHRRYKVYNQLARATYGEVFHLMKSDITDILEYVKENTKSRSDIIAFKKFPPGYGHKLNYFVDSKMNDLIISVTGLKPKIEVTDSEGNKVHIKHILNKDEIAIMKATDLKPGVYVADVGSTSETYVKVMAKTSVNFFYGFSSFETSSLSDTATRPAPDGDAYLSIKLQGEGVKLESVKIFDMDGNILEELPLRLNNEKERFYVTKSFHPPNVAFQLSVFGYVEENNGSIKRTSSTPIERQSEKVGPAVNMAPSLTIIEGPTLFVDYRSPLQVKCKVHGYPKPDITWQEKDSGVIIPSNVRVIEAPYDFISILNIEKPNKNSTYECKAQNALGMTNSNIKVETNVYFNVLETPPGTVQIEYGKEGNIQCIIDASPPASISWHNNGSLLSNDTDIVISHDMKTVTIKNATLESQGIFMCEAKNEYNSKTFFSKVSIIGLENPVIDKRDEKIRVVKGADAQITCRILRGTPKPTMQWNFQHKTKNLKELEETNEALLLKNVSIDDEGKYTCNASNIVGSQSYTIDVIVEYPPTIREDGIKTIETKDGDEVILPCNIDGLPTPKVRWLRNSTILPNSKNILLTSDFSLKITAVGVSDTGSYTCEAKNSLGSSQKTVDVYVFEKPAIEKPVEKIRAVKGADVQLTCRTLRGTPKPSILWHFQHKTKNLKELEERNESLLLKNISVDDDGKYTCNASNIVGSQSYTIDVIVEYPPTIREDGIKIIETKDGDEVILPCNVDGLPTPKVRWLRNSTILPNSKNILITSDFSLKITAVGVSDTGSYTCEAENSLGSSQKTVDVYVFEKPVIEKPVEKIRAVKGADVQLTCRTLRGTPKPSILWHFQHKTKNLKELEERNESLLLKNISVDDEGKYTCNASNIVGSQSYTIDVIVEYPPTIREDGIKIIETKDGDEVILPCNVDGLPTPKVRWLRNSTILPNSKNILITSDFSLKITAVGVSDTGSYTCEAENSLGSSQKTVDVYVFEKPVIEKPVEKIRAVKGADVQLTCRTLRGTPKPSILWHFQHKTKNLKELEERNESLLLKNISVDDEGKYTCNASNIVGSQSYTIDVILEYPPTIREDGIKIIETKDGDEVILPCNVDGLPTPKVRWLRNSTILPNSNNILITSDFSLKITAVGVSDTGSYTCEAENSLGSSQKTVDVYVFEKPVIEKPVEKIRAVKGADVQLTCRTLRGTPKPSILWHFQHKTKNLKELEERNESLLLKNISVDDEGKYTCNASNIVGSQSYTIDVIVEYPPTIREDGIKIIETKDGDEVILPCNVDGLPTPKVRWLRNSTILPNSKNILITSDFSLKITAVGVSDTGSYTCEAKNSLGSSQKIVDVYVFEKPVIEKPVEKIRAVKGADVQLTCRTLRGTPKPSILWHFQHKTKNLKELEERNESLLLKNISVDDEGKYTCNASNIVGSQSYTIDVIVEYPPTIREDGIKIIETKDGDEVILPCNVDGLPTPKVRWLRNSTILPNSKNILITSDFSLKITAVGVSDTGSYTCEAKNSLGSSQKTVDVYVFEKPVIEKPVEKIRAVKGADVQLTCRTLRGTPKPSILWHFQHKTKNLKELEERNESLLLKNISVDDEGKYTCNASNIVGSQSYTIDVIVEYPPTIREDGIKIIETKDGDEVILPCNVDGLPTPKVRWLRNSTILPNSKNILITSDFSLKITAVGVSDTGSYTCEAKNSLGSSQKIVDVYVFEKPVIEKPVEKIRAVKGADVQLTCRTLRGTPKPSILWHFQHKTKNLKELEERNESLLLKNISVDDEGKYTCNASNIVGSQSYTIDVIVEYPPTIREDGIKIIETKDGDEVILPCNVDGLPTPKVRWLRNSTILPNSKNILITSDFSLKITAVGVSDTGSYTCEAKNSLGSSQKTVDVYVFEKPVIEKPVEKIRAVKGADVQLTCRTLRGTPKPSILWHFQHKTKNLKELEERNESLLLKNISVDDEGKYTCNASNIVGSQSYTIDVIVEYPPTIREDGIKIIETKDGDEVILPCNVDGLPTPKVRWLRNSTILPNSKNILITSDFSLKITAVGVSDTGSYTCEAENSLGSSQKTVDVYVFEKPVIEKPVEKIRAVKGADVQLTCRTLRGTPKPSILWHFQHKTKNLKELEERNESLLLKNISVDDEGKYTCNASNIVGSQSYTIDVIVEYPPTIREDGIKIIETKDGDEVILPCNVDGLPTPKVRWLRNSTILPNSKNILITSDFSLKITAVGVSDTGSYTCEAENSLGSSQKTVDVYVFEKPVIEKPVEKIRAVKGADVQLTCRTLRGTPKPSILWHFQHKTKNLKELEERNESLLLKNISVDDEGKYTCNASNIVGSQSYTIDVIVEYPPTIREDGIKIIETKDGDEVILPCNVDGLPTPKVRWLRNSTILPNSKNILITSDFSLKITAVGVSDTGSYTCEAKNSLGSSQKIVDVYVFEKPVIEKPVEKIRAVKGADVQLTCRTLRGTPKPSILWHFQHKTKNLKELEERNESLLLKNISVDDEGKYTCNASNIVGSQSYTIDVIVEYPPTIREDGIKIIETKDGDEVILPCNVDGLPTPKVRWLRNSTILPNSKNILITSDFSLKITAVGVSDTGSYTCEAKNSLGSSQKTVDVYVFEKPVIEKPVEKIRAVKGADVQLTCRTLRGTPKPSILWHFQHKTKNLKELEERNESLLLKNISVDDEGKYTCNASNIVGSQSYTIDVIVEYPPTIREDGIKIIETKDGDEVILPCNVDGLPTPKVRWLRNSTILPNSKNILITSDFSLKITAVGVSDTGSYTCEAENSLGSSQKTVDVYVFEKPVIEKPVEKIRAVKRADVQLTCRTLRGTPKPSILWHFQHKTKNLKELEERNESLLLKNISVDDEGKYTCNASNIMGSQSYTIDVILEYPPTIREDGIKIIENKDGDEVILPCNVDGLPTPKVTWLRNSTILPNSKNILITSDFSLKITAVGVSDTGSYTCEAENSLGSSQKTVDVYVFEKPVIEKPVEKIRAVKGADVQLTCRTLRGTPKPSILWHFQHKTKNLKELEERNESLLLKNISVDDEGKYTCNASNIVGSQSYTIDVIVEYPPTIREDGIKIIETKDGDEVILPCNVDGLPTPKVRWLRNSTILPNSKNILITSDFSLKITAVGVSDTGSYTCEAENSFGSSQKTVDVYVFEKPVIEKPVEKIRAVKGADVQLTCRTLRGTPNPTILWHFQHKTKNLRELEERNEALLLKNLSVDGEGKYTCNASNVVGSQSYTIDVIVEYPPTIKEDGIKMVQTLYGNEVTLPCNVDGVPTPTVRWVRNSTTVHTTEDIFTTNDHSLKIRTTKLSDTGLYTCVAENYLDTSNKSIIVYVFEKPVIDKPYEETRALKGTDVTLTCRIVRGTPKPTMQWYVKQRKAKKFREIKDDNEALLIKNVRVDDEGTYKCNASNTVGSQSYTIDMVVEYPPTIKDDGTKMVKALNGDEVTLSCSVDGVPTPTAKWVRNGITLHTSKDIVITSDHSLKIKSTKLSDAGIYTCVAENYLNTSSKSISVYVFEKPVIDKPYGETRAPKGTDVKLACRIVRGTPKPTMQWYFKQRQAKKFREIKNNNEALLIKTVRVDDEGTYKCNASNTVGSQSYTMDLVVEYPPTIKDDGTKMIKALNGDEVTLPCSVDGVPTPTAKWVRNGITLHTSKDIVITSDHSLKIRTTKLSDGGIYTCVAENYLDTSSKSISVYVFEKPVIDNPYGETRALKGTDVKLTCRIVRGTPKPTMQWYFKQRKAKKFTEIKNDNEALLIKTARVDDEGTYKCNASNIVGSQSYTMDLVVEYPPTIKDDGIKVIKALNGDEVTLPCSVDGIPTPTVKWVRNGITLHTSKNIVITSDHSLKFRAIKVSDTGYYTCKAENRFGPSKKTILVYVFEKPVIVKPKQKIRAVEGAYVQLICRISRGTPKPTIQWHFRPRKAKKFRELKKNKETLPFKDVRVVNAGTYMCNASNIVGSQHYTMDLTVEYPPTIRDDGIKRINAKDGDDVTLPCNVDGVPTPTIKWLNGDTTLRRSKKFLTTSNNSLKITTIHVPDTGYYTCQAKNHLGTNKKTVFVFVFVQASIQEPKTSTMDIMVGTDLILPCHANGYPEPEIKWLFKEFDTKATPRRLRSNDKAKVFNLPRVQLRDQGNYTCEASNIGGTTNITYIVNVNAPPIIQNLYAVKTFTCVKGDLGLRIQCKATGYPKPSIVWKKDDLNIVSGSKWFDIDEGALIIKNIEKRQQGTYTCLATNRIGFDSSVYTVIVNDYPIVPKIESPMIIGPSASFDVPCNIKNKDTDFIRWYKDSKLIAYGKLTLKNISYLDSGIYSCRVGDMWQSSSSHVEIIIGYKPSFYKNEMETIQFKKGSFYLLSCLAKGQPEPKATWTFNGKTMSVSSMIHSVEMTINSRGKYTCEISNSLGSIERSFQIISPDCILEIKKDLLHNNQPMMLTPHMTWPLFPIDDGFMLIEKGELFYLHCPDNFVKFPMNYIRAFCAGDTQIQINGNIYEHSEIECKKEIKPVLNKQTSVCLFGNGVNVEVGYKIFRNFLNVYTVCLDKKNNVPLYTQHILTPDQYNVSTNKNVWWPTYLSPYNFDKIYNCQNQAYDISSILERPFHYNDKCCFGKRQLVSPMDFKPGIPASTAYTYLNVVPHWSTCNSKNWAEIEQKVRNLAKLLNTELTVLTGTVEPLQMRGRRGFRRIIIHDDLGKELRVAQYLWKVVQDPASASSLAIIQVNAPDLSPKDIPILTRCKDICEEIEWMKGTNWRNVADGYTYCCSILDFETAFHYTGEFSRGKTGVLNMRSDTPSYPDYSDYSDY